MHHVEEKNISRQDAKLRETDFFGARCLRAFA